MPKMKMGATATLTAMSAAALGTVMAAPAEAACASVFGIGNSAQCQSSFGNVAVSLSNTGSASATGGLGNLAFESGGSYSTVKDGLGSLAIGVGAYNGTSVTGWFNKGINIGDFNTALVTGKPELDLSTKTIGLGNNTVLNIGDKNFGIVGDPTSKTGSGGGFSNGVYQFGDGNQGLARGVVSNVVQHGDYNHGLAPQNERLASQLPNPNVAAGLGATNLVFGNYNTQNVIGNLSLGTIKGDDNVVTNVDPKLTNPNTPLLQSFLPSLNVSTVRGNNNNRVFPALGNPPGVTVSGTYNFTSVRGDNNAGATSGNGNVARTRGDYNFTSVQGNHSAATSRGTGNFSAAIGNFKRALNGINNK